MRLRDVILLVGEAFDPPHDRVECLMVKRGDLSTALAALAQKNNGVWVVAGAPTFTRTFPERQQQGPDDNRDRKRRLVDQGTAHAALIIDGDVALGDASTAHRRSCRAFATWRFGATSHLETQSQPSTRTRPAQERQRRSPGTSPRCPTTNPARSHARRWQLEASTTPGIGHRAHLGAGRQTPGEARAP